MTDTDPKTEALYRQMLMERSPQERFMMGIRMCEMARAMVLASLPKDLSPAERQIALVRRYYESDLSPQMLARVEADIRRRFQTQA